MEHIFQVTSSFFLNANGDMPEWVHIMPAGTFKADDGRGPFTLKDAQAVINASIRPSVEMPVDRDHELVYAQGTGKHVHATGWVKGMEARDNGIWARVEWTAEGLDLIKSKKYRYISPVFTTKKDGEVVRIRHISLVIEPALELTAVANRQSETPNLNNEEETTMDKFLKAMAVLYGLKEDAKEDAILAAAQAACKDFKAQKAEIASVREALGLDKDADAATVLEAASKQTTGKTEVDAKDVVPMAMYDKLRKDFVDLKEQIGTDKAEAAVAAAMKEGKLAPAQKEWAMQFASKDLTAFEDFLEHQPVIIEAGETTLAGKKAAKAGELNDTDQQVCNQLGLTRDQFLGKTQKEGDE